MINPFASPSIPADGPQRSAWRLVVVVVLVIISLALGFVGGREYEARQNFAHETETSKRHTEEVGRYLQELSDLHKRLER